MTDKKDWEVRFDHEFVKNNGENVEDSFRDPNGDVGPVKQFIGAELFKERMKAEVETGLKNFQLTMEEIAKARQDERQKVLALLDKAELEQWFDMPNSTENWKTWKRIRNTISDMGGGK